MSRTRVLASARWHYLSSRCTVPFAASRCLYEQSCIKDTTVTRSPDVYRAWLEINHGRGLSTSVPHSKLSTRSVTFKLAQLGEGIAECELLSWHVKVGDQLEEFGPVCEVQSDKANVEITSPFTGLVQKLYGSVGDMIQVGAPLVDIAVEGGAEEPNSEGKPPTPATPSPADQTSQSISKTPVDAPLKTGRVLASPSARALARQHSISLAGMAGSGSHGQITKDDIMAVVNSPPTPAPSTPGKDAPQARTPHPSFSGEDPELVRVPLSGYRRGMVQAMTAAALVPTFHLCDEINMAEVLKARDTLRQHHTAEYPLTSLPFLIKALSLALIAHPEVNSRMSADLAQLEVLRDHNVGVAIATDSGLVVPCIKQVQTLSILGIAEALHTLKSKAVSSRLGAAELSGTTITLSNIGVIGGTYATPLVNPPQIAICALGRLRQTVEPAGGETQVVPTMNVSWGADHRALDGAALAYFNKTWKQFIEDPALMLQHLR